MESLSIQSEWFWLTSRTWELGWDLKSMDLAPCKSEPTVRLECGILGDGVGSSCCHSKHTRLVPTDVETYVLPSQAGPVPISTRQAWSRQPQVSPIHRGIKTYLQMLPLTTHDMYTSTSRYTSLHTSNIYTSLHTSLSPSS